MAVQQVPHLSAMHPANHSPYKAGYMNSLSPYRERPYVSHDEDSSHSHHSESGLDRASPAPHPDSKLYQHPTVYGSYSYKSLPTEYSQQVPRHFPGYPGEAIMDYSQKAVKVESQSPPPLARSPHDEAIAHEEAYGHGSGHHAVAGGMVGARLDSEGNSVKSSTSDSGSYVSDAHPAGPQSQSPRSHSPTHVLDTNSRHSPLSTSSSGNGHHSQQGTEQYAHNSPSDQPMNERPQDHMTTGHPITEHYQDNTSPENCHSDEESQTHPRSESPELRSPRTPENAPQSPPSGKTGSAKKQRQSSPNMNKIEAVINNLRTAKAKKKKQKEPVGPGVGLSPAAVHHQQLPANDPRNLWAMYALSQYAMMAPGGATGGYYPYPSAEGAAYPYPGVPGMMGHGVPSQRVSPVNDSPIGKKRKQPDSDDYSQPRQPYFQSPEEAGHHRPHNQQVKSEPLDFSRGAPAQSPPDYDKSPTYSPSQRLERTRSPATKPKNRDKKEMMMNDHNVLWAELKELLSTVPGVKAVLEGYQGSVDELETERYQALLDNISSDKCKDAVHAYFNQERHSLVHRVREQLTAAKQQAEAAHSLASMPHMMGRAQMPFSHSTSSPFTPVMTTSSMAAYPYANALYGLASSVPSAAAAAAAIPNFGAYSPMASYMATAMADDAAVMYNQNGEEDNDNSSKRKFLTPDAVSLLQTWYDKNADHPYPDEETVEDLASEAKVSLPQVKKWMANKRVRSSNTLAFNGSIHPKKIQKLIQLKEMAETAGQHSTAPAQAAQVPQQQPLDGQSPQAAAIMKNRNTSGSGKKNKRLLDPAAVSFMTKWYHEHIMYPYPTDDEKHQIADSCGLTVSQVTCWFANKRNRSNHSRKHNLVADMSAVGNDTVYDKFKQGDMAPTPQGDSNDDQN